MSAENGKRRPSVPRSSKRESSVNKTPVPLILGQKELDAAEAPQLELLKLTAPERLKLALSSLVTALAMPVLLARKRLPRDIDQLMILRWLRHPGRGGRVQVPTTTGDEDHSVYVERARRQFLQPGSLLFRYGCLACRELVKREGLELLPQDSGRHTSLGLGAGALDMLLHLQGLELGAVGRSRLISELVRTQVVESERENRWFRYRAQSPELTDDEEQLRSRMLFMSNLNLTVIQRFQATPGHLKFMGFMSTAQDRQEMNARLRVGLWEKLQALRVPFWSVRPGEEAELTCVIVGVAVGARYGASTEPVPLFDDALVQTVVADVVARLGVGEDPRSFIQRMLLDRVLEEARVNGIDPTRMTRHVVERLGVNRDTVRRWRSQASCEEGDIQRPFARTVVPELTLRLFGLAQERWPKGMTVIEFREHAMERGWPPVMQDAANIELVLERLVALHRLVRFTIQPKLTNRFINAYRALDARQSFAPGPPPDPEVMISGLRKCYEIFLCPEGAEQPHFTAHQAIIRRSALPELISHLKAMMEAVRETMERKYEVPIPQRVGTVQQDSYMVIQCSSQQIGMKKPNGRYT